MQRVDVNADPIKSTAPLRRSVHFDGESIPLAASIQSTANLLSGFLATLEGNQTSSVLDFDGLSADFQAEFCFVVIMMTQVVESASLQKSSTASLLLKVAILLQFIQCMKIGSFGTLYAHYSIWLFVPPSFFPGQKEGVER